MPPKKKQRVEPSATSTPQPEARQPSTISTPSIPHMRTTPAEEDLLRDPWTAKQEATLFKALIRYKPTGVNKHFNIMSVAHEFDDLEAAHTRIPGIWSKLATMYDLDALDEREENYAKSITNFDSLQTEAEKDFSIEKDPDMWNAMLNRKLGGELPQSPVEIPFLLDRDGASEVSESPAPGKRFGRGGGRLSAVGITKRQSQMSKAEARRGSGVEVSEASPEGTNDEDAEDDGTEQGEDASQGGLSPPARTTRNTRALSGRSSKKK